MDDDGPRFSSCTRRVLVVSYHFPPVQASSGVHRTLGFARHLPEFGWSPHVLTVWPMAYEQWSVENNRLIPDGLSVTRAPALDSARHLSVRGRHLRAMALPDRWVTWIPGAVATGLWLVRRYRPDVIFTTYPIASAHIVGWILNRLTKLPWVADFRDPMAQEEYPADAATWRSFAWVEERVVRHAAALVFTAPSARDYYLERYPALAPERLHVLENGYEENHFRQLDLARQEGTTSSAPRRCVILHSGIVYPKERDPEPLFRALGMLAREDSFPAGRILFRFRASGNAEKYSRMARDLGAGDLVEFLPAVGYLDALTEMRQAGALLVMQASDCNFQIPAKIYEYLRAKRPIIGICDPRGDTARLLRNLGVDAIAPLDSPTAIANLLRQKLPALAAGEADLPDVPHLGAMTRRSRAAELARILDGVTRQQGRG